MTVPGIVADALGDESIQARIELGGDDELFVTPSHTVLYRAEGLLSDESIATHTHDATRLALTTGRRKSTITLDHGLDGDTDFTVPTKRVDPILEAVLTGVLAANNITDPDETVEEVYRLGELTIIVTTHRVIKHIGDAVWDDEYEEYAYSDVTGIDIEKGDISSQVIIEVNNRPQRIKVPSGDALEIRHRIEEALLNHYDVDNYTEFLDLVDIANQDTDPPAPEPAPTDQDTDSDTHDPAPDTGVDAIQFDDLTTTSPTTDDPDTHATDTQRELAELRAAIEHQTELLEQHHDTLEQLIKELRRGR